MHEIFVKMNDFFQAMGVQGLALNSFIESFFLVPPPDFLLIAMDLANPKNALFYAFVCIIASAWINDYDFDETINYHIEETANNFDTDLQVYPIDDCFNTREEAEQALRTPQNDEVRE